MKMSVDVPKGESLEFTAGREAGATKLKVFATLTAAQPLDVDAILIR